MGLLFKQLLQQQVGLLWRKLPVSAVPVDNDLLVFIGAEQADILQRSIWLCHHLLQHPHIMAPEPLNGGSLEQGHGILKHGRKLITAIVYKQREIKLGRCRPFRQRYGLNGVTVSQVIHRRKMLHSKQYLKQRMTGRVPFNGQLFHQLLKRNLLVLLHIGDAVMHLRNQIPETLLSIDCRADHQSIGEETHQRLQLRVMAIGNGAAHRQIILATVAAEQQGKSTEHHGI